MIINTLCSFINRAQGLVYDKIFTDYDANDVILDKDTVFCIAVTKLEQFVIFIDLPGMKVYDSARNSAPEESDYYTVTKNADGNYRLIVRAGQNSSTKKLLTFKLK